MVDPDFWLSTVEASLVQPIFYRQELTIERQQAKALEYEIAQNNFYSSLLQAWQNIENLNNNEFVLAQQRDAAQAHDSASRVK